jgi:hypothetical protein
VNYPEPAVAGFALPLLISRAANCQLSAVLANYLRNLTPGPLLLPASMKCKPVASVPLSRRSISLPSPPNDVGFNLTVGPDAAPRAVNPKTGKREHVSAIVIFTKQFHQFPGWGFTD